MREMRTDQLINLFPVSSIISHQCCKCKVKALIKLQLMPTCVQHNDR